MFLRGAIVGLFAGLMLATVSLPVPSRAQTVSVHATVSDTVDVGYLTIQMRKRIDSLYVVVDYRFDKPHYVANGTTIAVPVGERHFTIATKYTRDLAFPQNVRAGETDTLRTSMVDEEDQEVYFAKSSYPVLHNGSNLLVTTDRDSRVFVDGVQRGLGETAMRVSEGVHLIETIHPEAGRTERQVVVQMDPPRLRWAQMHNKPKRGKALGLSLLPGGAQLYKDQTPKGIVLISGFVAASVGGVYQHLAFRRHNRDYGRLHNQYERAKTEEEAFRLGNQTEQFFNAAQRASRWRNILSAVAIGSYMYSLFDGVLTHPPGGYRTPYPRATEFRPLLGRRKRGLQLVVHF